VEKQVIIDLLGIIFGLMNALSDILETYPPFIQGKKTQKYYKLAGFSEITINNIVLVLK